MRTLNSGLFFHSNFKDILFNLSIIWLLFDLTLVHIWNVPSLLLVRSFSHWDCIGTNLAIYRWLSLWLFMQKYKKEARLQLSSVYSQIYISNMTFCSPTAGLKLIFLFWQILKWQNWHWQMFNMPFQILP